VAWRLTSARAQAVAGGAALGVAVLSTVTVQWGLPWIPARWDVAGITLVEQKGYLRGAPDAAPSTPLALVTAMARDDEWRQVTAGRRVGLLRFDFTRDEPHFHGWGLKHASWELGHVVEMEEEPGVESQVDFTVVARCAGEPWPQLPGFDDVVTVPTPGGCTARLLKNTRLREEERRVRAAPPLGVRYRAQLMEQTLLAAALPDGEVRPGQDATATFLVRVDVARWSRRLQRTLRLGPDGPVVATWETAEPRYQKLSEYAFSVDLRVPAGTPAGDHPLLLGAVGPTGPAELLDPAGPHAASKTQVTVGRLRVGPPAP
jgi:hypothetical protein